jgi:hypothetical protein
LALTLQNYLGMTYKVEIPQTHGEVSRAVYSCF